MGRLADALRNIVQDLRSFTLGPLQSDGRGDPTLRRLFAGAPAVSGVPVNHTNASGLAVAWACVSLLSGAAGLCTPYLYRKRGDGARERHEDHALYSVLVFAPNEHMTATAFRELALHHLLLRGVFYAEIVRDAGARPRALYPLHPDTVAPALDGGRLRYRVASGDRQVTLDPDHMLAVLGPHSPDGVTPVSVVERARNAFGNALATEQWAGRFFANSASPAGLLTHPGRMTPEAREAFTEWMRTHFTGVENAHRLLLLEEGIQFAAMTFTPEASQLLESRRFSSEEVCRLFGVPPALVGVATTTSGTYENVEQQQIRFLQFSLLPWLKRLEAAYNARLVSSLERFQQYVEHDTNAILRADLAARFAAYKIAAETGILTIAEIREKENLGPLPGADR